MIWARIRGDIPRDTWERPWGRSQTGLKVRRIGWLGRRQPFSVWKHLFTCLGQGDSATGTKSEVRRRQQAVCSIQYVGTGPNSKRLCATCCLLHATPGFCILPSDFSGWCPCSATLRLTGEANQGCLWRPGASQRAQDASSSRRQL